MTAPGGEPAARGASRAGLAEGEQVAAVLTALREILAQVTGSPAAGTLPADTPLFRAGAGLDSLTGTLLLREVRRRLGVDVAAADLNLDSLASLDTLAAFIAAHRAAG